MNIDRDDKSDKNSALAYTISQTIKDGNGL